MSQGASYAKDFCAAEMMTVCMARIMKEQKLRRIAAGMYGQIVLLAARLAQATSIPDLLVFSGPAGVCGSKFKKLSWLVGGENVHEGAEFRFSLDYVMDCFGNERIYLGKKGGFMGGFQIDKHGNVNMSLIGDPKKPKFRGPGTVGLMALCFTGRNLFTRSHTPRMFVEKVDFISGPGWGDGPGWREEHGCLPNTGPDYCVTPICLFDFDEKTKIMRIKSVHPGHTVEEVVEKTGFKPIIPENVPETEPPTIEELAFMRAMDPDRILPRLTDD